MLKTGFVGVIGLPNAGKTSLVNALVGEKVGIVTAKPQTTRQRVLGIFSDSDSQIIFVDAPGIIKATSGLNHFLQLEWDNVIEESDALLVALNIDAESATDIEKVLDVVTTTKKPKLAVITKTDLPYPHRLPMLKAKLDELGIPFLTASISRSTQELREDLLPDIKSLLPTSTHPLYDSELYTTQSQRELAQEIIREHCFSLLHQEIPYNLAVQVRKFIENKGPVIKVYADIILTKENHKPMVVGKGGQSIKSIGMQARQELEKILGRRIHLELFVRVKKNWVRESHSLRELGYAIEP